MLSVQIALKTRAPALISFRRAQRHSWLRGKNKGTGKEPGRPSNLTTEDRRRKLADLKARTERKTAGNGATGEATVCVHSTKAPRQPTFQFAINIHLPVTLRVLPHGFIVQTTMLVCIHRAFWLRDRIEVIQIRPFFITQQKSNGLVPP